MRDHDDANDVLSNTSVANDVSGMMPSPYARLIAMVGLPGVDHYAATVTVNAPLGVGGVERFRLDSFRSDGKDMIAIEHISGNEPNVKLQRIVLPPKVVARILRQHDQLTAKSRSRKSKAAAQARKDRGELPGFMKKKKEVPQ